MKKFFLALLIGSLFTSTSHAKDSRFGLGVIIGDPTGLSAKLWLDRAHAIDFGLAYSWDQDVLTFADFLWQFPRAFGSSSQFVSQLTPYVGVGGLIEFFSYGHYYGPFYRGDSYTAAGVRVPLGIEWNPTHPPLGVIVELVPGIYVIPGTAGFIGADVGIRYYFN